MTDLAACGIIHYQFKVATICTTNIVCMFCREMALSSGFHMPLFWKSFAHYVISDNTAQSNMSLHSSAHKLFDP